MTNTPSADEVAPAPSGSDLRIFRFYLPGQPTLGTLTAGDLSLCTLELPWLDNHPLTSCIPEGTYPLQIVWSNRFKRDMPKLIDVPGRSGILIHPGNVEANTEGCILVGESAYGYTLRSSDVAFAQIFDWIESAPNHSFLTIASNGGPK